MAEVLIAEVWNIRGVDCGLCFWSSGCLRLRCRRLLQRTGVDHRGLAFEGLDEDLMAEPSASEDLSIAVEDNLQATTCMNAFWCYV